MPRLFRCAVIVAITCFSSSALAACRYTAKGKVYEAGRWWKFKVVNQPCVDQAPVIAQAAPVYIPPPVYAAPPAAGYYVAPPPPPPMYAPAPPPPTTAGMVIANAPAPRVRDDRPSLLALKYTGGGSSSVAFDNGPQFGTFGFTHTIGLEVRLSRWLALTSDYEMRPEGRSWDMIGAKVWLIPSWALKPYAQVSLAGSESYSLPGKYQLGVSAAVGADLFFGKHSFIEAEARYRVSPGAGECCREVPHLAAQVGAGVAFF